ncbi:prolyl aminopeptidase-2 [Lentinus tigrinus ALCF2SS1-7]|uniref:Prolyl aminopeptidase-2 n=1 Tax=Lentinus tigrinus ALCF2SS1-6 TaxID=1328759 RepID=A0A5C2SUW4_9APHY|nr:prolyl aminopeptidase-2 [Lentinus tigrinus ALCF2SS1-6]RPD81034.1 prolyl aminopeptidase-2 [Lentinus tigrinus ALCF2SS1-7]
MVNPTVTGTVDFDARAGKPCQTWYQVYGDLKSGETPVVAIHGGPGSTHHYILSMADLFTIHGIPVVLYDQLGNGNSTHLPEKSGDAGSFWTEQLFLDELDNLLRHLGIQDNYSLLGQSWGGMLASRHASRRPKGLQKLIISDSPANMHMFEKGAHDDLIPKLPPDVRDALIKHEEAGTTESKEYQDAMSVFYKRHLCRLDPWPAEVLQSFEWMEKDHTVYYTMNGPSEFFITGSLKDWSMIDDAPKIEVPTLLLSGAYDEIPERAIMPFFKGIPKVKWFTFAESSHMPHWEEREKYMRIAADFLTS